MKTVYMCFPGGRFKTLSLSYDDGAVADRRLVDLFNAHGIRGTFHLNAGTLGQGDRVQPEEVASLYAGHEVSAHSYSHPTLERCAPEQRVWELMEDRRALEELVGYPVRGLSYPNGSHDAALRELLPALGMEYARVVPSSGGFALPPDSFAWQPTCHHTDRLLARSREFLDLEKSQYLFHFNVWGHSWEFDRDGNWGLIEEACELLGGREEIWYASYADIVANRRRWEALRFSVDMNLVENPAAEAVWVAVDGLPVEIPGGWRGRLSA